MSEILFVTHPEVIINPEVPLPRWPLSDVGRARMMAFAEALSGREIAAIYSSDEQKARDGADILAHQFGLEVRVRAGLEEHDRSATGYIPVPEFWEVVEQFFARPSDSIRGWMPAHDAQNKIVRAVCAVAQDDVGSGSIVIVSHGGVGRLLRAHLDGVPIGNEDRPSHPGGGCYFPIDRKTLKSLEPWRAIEEYM